MVVAHGSLPRWDPSGWVLDDARRSWPTDVVAVIAAVDQQHPPQWMIDNENVTYVVYQRTHADRPWYSPNYALEAGVFVQFILDHYERLPKLTAFLQANPADHSPEWHTWLRCLRPDAQYTPLSDRTTHVVRNRSLTSQYSATWAGTIAEQCWRTLLDAFRLGERIPPRVEPIASFHCCSQFVASRAQLLQHPRAAWATAHALLAGGLGRCGLHSGSALREDLYTCVAAGATCTEAKSRAVGLGAAWESALRATLSVNDADHGRLGALAFEQWQHVLVGLQPIHVPPHAWCRSFRPHAHCPGSPCQAPPQPPAARSGARSKEV